MKRFFESRWFLVVCIVVGALFGTAISQVYEWHIDQKIEKAISSERDAPAQQVELVPAPPERDTRTRITRESEKPTLENLPPLEARILDALSQYLGYGLESVNVLNLWLASVEGDETQKDFYKALDNLYQQGKVVRVSGPTSTEHSTWAFPTTE